MKKIINYIKNNNFYYKYGSITGLIVVLLLLFDINAFFFFLVFLTCVLTDCLYLDLRYRTISNDHFKFFFGVSFLINSLELYRNIDLVVMFVVLKFIVFIIVFLIVFGLYIVRLFGGADGKLVLLIFITFPLGKLNFGRIYFFFFVLCFLFVIYISLTILGYSSFIAFRKLVVKTSVTFLKTKFYSYLLTNFINIEKNISFLKKHKIPCVALIFVCFVMLLISIFNSI